MNGERPSNQEVEGAGGVSNAPVSGFASNLMFMVWMAALALIVVRVAKPSLLTRLGLHEYPTWRFGVLLGVLTLVWCVVEWGTLKPFLLRSWGTARDLGFSAVLGVLATVLPPLGSIVLYWYIKPFATWLREHPSGVLIYLAAFVLLGGVALLPTYAQSALGGFAFGLKTGIPLALMGFAGAAMLGFAIAARANPARVQRVIDRDPRAGAIRRALVGGGLLRQVGLVSLIRLPPNSPFALTNLLLTAAGVKWLPFLIGTVVGMTPRTVVAVYIGASVKELAENDSFEKARPDWVLWAGIAASVLVLIVIMVVAKRALAGVLGEGGQRGGVS